MKTSKNKICFSQNEIIKIRSLSLAKTLGIKTVDVKKPSIYVILLEMNLLQKIIQKD